MFISYNILVIFVSRYLADAQTQFKSWLHGKFPRVPESTSQRWHSSRRRPGPALPRYLSRAVGSSGQSNARLLPAMPVIPFSPTGLWKQPWPCSISQQQLPGQACRHSRGQAAGRSPSHSALADTLPKSQDQIWPHGKRRKTPPGSSAFSCPKAGHDSSGASRYLLILQSPSFESQEEDHCCPEKLTLFSYGTTAITDSRLHTGDVQAKSKIFTASEKQPAPVATDGADSHFLWVGAAGFSTFTDQAIRSVIWSLLLARYL